MNKILKILVGLVLLIIPLYLVFPGSILEIWGQAVLTLLKGGVTILVVLVGLILIILGISEIGR